MRILFLFLLAGCAPTTAVVNGKAVPRLSAAYRGGPYSLKHDGIHPSPGDLPKQVTDYGGTISGTTCGLDVSYDVKHQGDHISLQGMVDNSHNSQIEIRDQDGARQVVGTMGFASGASVIDVRFTADKLTGRVGYRDFNLRAEGDDLVGVATLLNQNLGRIEVHLAGRAALLSLPSSDQAIAIAGVLNCWGDQVRRGQMAKLEGRFGGEAAYAPANSSAFIEH